MADLIHQFFTTASPLELFLIFISKIVEVAISTLRIILISKGYRRQGTILSFLEILLWVFVASRVIMGITEAPIKGIVYSVGFSIGVYVGSLIEGRIALGRVLVQVIVAKDNSSSLVKGLREKGYAVTSIAAYGRDSEKVVHMIFANRKGKEEIVNDILELEASAMIVINEISTMYGGTIGAVKKFLK